MGKYSTPSSGRNINSATMTNILTMSQRSRIGKRGVLRCWCRVSLCRIGLLEWVKRLFPCSAQVQFITRNDQSLDLTRAFVNLRDLGVAEIALDWHLLAVAHPAVNLDGGVRAKHRGFAGKELRHAGLGGVTRAGGLRAFF